MRELMIQLAADNAYVLPEVATVIEEGFDFNMDLLKEAATKENPVFLVSYDLTSSDLTKEPYEIGTVVTIERIEQSNNKGKLFLKGLYRAKQSPYFDSKYVQVEKLQEKEVSLEKAKISFQRLLNKLMEYAKQEDSLHIYQTVEKFKHYDVQKINNLHTMAFLINKLTQIAMDECSFYPDENQKILEEGNMIIRATKVEENIDYLMINKYNETFQFPEYVHELPKIDDTNMQEDLKTIDLIEDIEIPRTTDFSKSKTKANYIEINSELEDIELEINKLKISREIHQKIQNEIDKARSLNKNSNEYRENINYLKLISQLPWENERLERDILEAESILNDSHYGMDKVKKEIMKFLAERKLNKNSKGTVLCLAGPPGVGKTSFVRSIAKALNKEFIQVKLGGVERESMIRGFERTYRGAMPGIFIKEMSNISSVNPVILLDEIDKISKGNSGEGDVASALLEVLDPSQNKEFRDHYLLVPYDLSKALFIATANEIDKIPDPLKDRMDIIYLNGYSRDEKYNIVKKYMVEKTLSDQWLKDFEIKIDDNVLMELIDQYVHEPGIRSLERSITKLFREIALKIELEKQNEFNITLENINEYFNLNEKVTNNFNLFKENQIGRVNLLKVITNGNDTTGSVGVLEVSKFPGKGELISTGNLGEVIRESVEVAFSYIRLNAKQLKIEHDFKEKYDFHIHFPEAAVPKDGPSAGIAIVIAIISAIKNQPIKYDIATTGEVSLYGNIRPVGAIKEKIIGAYLAGITKVIIPQGNEEEIQEIPKNIREKIEIVLVKNLEEVFEHVF